MREIKFKGKRVDNGEWIYGYYGTKLNVVTGDYDTFIIIPTYTASVDSSYFLDLQVISETVGQYTGQKDKNGIEIYENDIVSMDGESCNGAVKWLDDDCMFVVVYPAKIGFYETPGDWFQVIGSIHDNPELLEAK